MGNVVSRCAQNVRKVWRNCSKKPTEEEAMLSTCDSEPLDKCQEPLFGPAVTGVDPTGSQSSLVRLEEKMETVSCRLQSSSPKSSFKFCSSHHHPHSRGYKTLKCTADYDERQDSHPSPPVRSFVDQGSQTSFDLGGGSENHPKPPLLSKEYIVKTYSIQNATPTPSPGTQSKFSPTNHSVVSSSSLPILVNTEQVTGSHSPLANLERQQDDVLKRLEQLRASVSKLAQKYSDSETIISSAQAALSSTEPLAATAAAVTARSQQAQSTAPSRQRSSSSVTDLVISADPSSSIPLSLVVFCELLSEQFKVLKSTYIHSSVSDNITDKLRALITSNGGIKRADCQLIVNLVWKKVANGPTLVVDPTRQTPIQGEVNVVRYLVRLLNPSFDETDIVAATQIDELLDLAQLQLLEGSTKERAAAVKTLNTILGKQDWLVGSEPSTADIVCWSALHQINQVSSTPANVKKWLGLCSQHKIFQTATRVLN